MTASAVPARASFRDRGGVRASAGPTTGIRATIAASGSSPVPNGSPRTWRVIPSP